MPKRSDICTTSILTHTLHCALLVHVHIYMHAAYTYLVLELLLASLASEWGLSMAV